MRNKRDIRKTRRRRNAPPQSPRHTPARQYRRSIQEQYDKDKLPPAIHLLAPAPQLTKPPVNPRYQPLVAQHRSAQPAFPLGQPALLPQHIPQFKNLRYHTFPHDNKNPPPHQKEQEKKHYTLKSSALSHKNTVSRLRYPRWASIYPCILSRCRRVHKSGQGIHRYPR